MVWYEIVLGLYLTWVIAICIGFLVALSNDYFILFETPKELYESTKMNWFGCIFVWLLECLLNPIPWIGVVICAGIDWLFTVGRKD